MRSRVFKIYADPAALIVAALIVKICCFGWMAANALPQPDTRDILAFKQPGLEFLRTGHFALPSWAGALPLADEICAFYTPLYIYLNTIVFWLFGFSYPISSLLDGAVHIALASVSAWIIWRLTRSPVATGLFLLISSAFFLWIGRPDDLGALFALGALAARLRHDRPTNSGMVDWLLVLSVAASPRQGALGFASVAVYEWWMRVPPKQWLWSQIMRCAKAAVFLIVIWGPAFGFRYRDAWLQFNANVDLSHRSSLYELLMTNPYWAMFFASNLFLNVGLGYVLWRCPPSPERTTFGGLLAGLVAMIVISAVSQQPAWGYRACEMLMLALSFAGLVLVARQTHGAWLRIGTCLGWALCLMSIVPLSSTVVSSMLAPFLWDQRAVSYESCRDELARILPPGASVGADATICMALPQDPPVLAIRYALADSWPEYVACGQNLQGGWWVLGKPQAAKILAEQYEEIGPVGAPNSREKWLRKRDNFGDWSYRVWRRRHQSEL